MLNLLPIPVLDGGLIMFALIALVFRRRVPDKIVGTVSTGFMYVLIALMGFLIWRDSARSWRLHTRKDDTRGKEIRLKVDESAAETGDGVQTEVQNGAEAADQEL